MNFTQSLLKHIEKLVGTLKEESELREILKRKFTKKEFKVFVAFEEGKSIDEITQLVKEDTQRVEELYKNSCKKVNQEKIKKELVEI